MKTLLSCLMLLAFLISNGQSKLKGSAIKNGSVVYLTKYDTASLILMYYDERQLNSLDGYMGYSNASVHVVSGYMVTEEVFIPEHEIRDTPGEVGWMPAHFETKHICYLDPNKKRFSKNIKVKQW